MEGYLPKYKGSYIRPEDGILRNEELCRILSEVVHAKSVVPDEHICGEKLIEICEREGLTYEVIPVTDTRFNVMITVGADSYLEKKHGLMIHGHYDTVPFFEMKDPLETTITDNKMRGRGIVDQKSALVAGICAAIAIKRSGKSMKKPLCIACVVDEESEHRGSYVLGKSGVQADYAIVTEPTNTYRCEFGIRGTTPVRIHIQGKTAHAGVPWKGNNAIERALPILQELFALKFPEVDCGEAGTLKGTLCVSLMNAGTQYNNVPGEAEIWMDRRTVPGETNASALAQIKEVVDRCMEKDPELHATVEIARPDWKWEPIKERGLNPTLTPLDCPIFDIMNEAAKEAGFPKPIEKSLFEGYDDMDFLVNDLGIPTVTYGSGDAQMAHGPEEYVDIDEVCMVAELFCHMTEKLCM